MSKWPSPNLSIASMTFRLRQSGLLEPLSGPMTRRRTRVFALVFFLACSVSLLYTFIRPAKYQAAARLEITPGSMALAMSEKGTVIQKSPQAFLTEVQLLTSRPLLEEVKERLSKLQILPQPLSTDPVTRLQQMLTASPVEGTYVVQLTAEGREREFLPTVVNTVIDVYRARLVSAFQKATLNASGGASEEVRVLAKKMTEKRETVEAYRVRYNIVSLERDENQVLSGLKGLNTSLNAATEKVAAAEARLLAIKANVEAGKSVVRAKDNPTIANIEQRASQIKEELRDLERRFTPQYMARDPQVRAMRARLENLDQQLKAERQTSQKAALDEAQEELANARENVNQLRRQLAMDKQSAQAFSSHFNEYKSMADELNELEKAHRAAQERLAILEASERTRMPQLRILETATLPLEPSSPFYWRDAGISVAASLVLAFFTSLLMDYFYRSETQTNFVVAQPWMPISYGRETDVTQMSAPPNAPVHALPPSQLAPREFAEAEIAAMLTFATDVGRLAIIGLLLGLNCDELIKLRWCDIDPADGQLHIVGGSPRTLPVCESLAKFFNSVRDHDHQPQMPVLHNGPGEEFTIDELKSLIVFTALDAGIEGAQEVSPQAIRFSYLAYLVRQGVRFAEIGQIVGRLAADEMAACASLTSPRTQHVPLDQIQRIMPPLRDFNFG
jgi:polysaccharide biosynthesis transport protein